ncbi:type IV-A pilus assembly ATPase PilB [Haliangium ochraceum]|uniref:Type IV-A pilus assembly ATPase PilB n=1 Tax=Haliangium ochraceum (strain DSM 14365 / JCM 11303 / SMP-2) TaxID=502025 RepID=D0LSU6_HALO1|nr:type IV-A pilus assembly ATPase PilB [Haliangium ochraceum]ACY17318.1 type IV-A pilus assembly ATPase PilB [Haliangium ochraceum DSM 14365]
MSRIGELLVREKMITSDQLREAQSEAQRSGLRLGSALANLGIVDDDQLSKFVASQYGLKTVNLNSYTLDPELLKLIPKDVAQRHQVVPLERAGSNLTVAMSDPSNIYAIDELKFLTQYNIRPVVASENAIEGAIQRYYDKGPNLHEMIGDLDEDVDFAAADEESVNIVDLENQAGEAPVVKLCNAILLSAIKKGASDIHVEPYEKSFRVRFRIDGILHEEMNPPLRLRNAITSRLKIMSSLDIAERRLPQDGRIKLKIGKDREMDFRVSCLPTLFGEKIVLRLLDRSNLQLDMTRLGFEPEPLSYFKKAIHLPYGMVLVTGPTGSGKTTTLYSALSELNTTESNISTAEDPVEFNLPGINQVQMHEDIGLNFATSLRSFLRQDPNIIMVGEIRDFETAEIAVKAALTGHMVLSTLHTNDAPSTVSRLLNMGVEPFLVTASVNLVLAQRLARRICVECKEETEKHPEALRDVGMSEDMIAACKPMVGRGCSFCGETGYRGRVALYEVMPFTDDLKELVLQNASAAEIKMEMIRGGVQTLRMAGLNKIMEGMTTPEEVMRTTVAD